MKPFHRTILTRLTRRFALAETRLKRGMHETVRDDLALMESYIKVAWPKEHGAVLREMRLREVATSDQRRIAA